MRITNISSLPATCGVGRHRMSFFFVRLETDEGLVGYGEACDSYGVTSARVLAAAVDDILAPLLLGEELTAVTPLAERLRLFTRRKLGDQSVGPQARSALEIAMWDVLGRERGVAVSTLLGRVRDSVAVYASSVFLEECSAERHHELLSPMLDRGVRMVKVRMGPDWRADVTTLAQLRGRLGDEIDLMIDGSENYTLPTALRIADALAELGVVWFEEPLPQSNRAGIEELVARSPVAIAYGEHLYGREDAIEALRRRQVDVLQPDASIAGGIEPARAMAAVATGFGVRVVPHVCAGPVSLAANLHLAACSPTIHAIEYPLSLAPTWATLGGGHLCLESIVDGEIAIPSTPGLGLDLDEDAVAAHPYEPPGVRASGTVVGIPDRFVGDI